MSNNNDFNLSDDVVKDILDSLSRIPVINVNDFPNIDLYMDQVMTFMDQHLTAAKRSEDDKILTKTMINNYAKNKLLPPPVKKKYSREHLIVMIYIYYFKGILSLQDIQTLLQPMTDRYFNTDKSPDLAQIYQEIIRLSQKQTPRLKEDISGLIEIAESAFPDADKEDQAFLRYFALISCLSIDVYIKKKLIERLIDLSPPPAKKK